MGIKKNINIFFKIKTYIYFYTTKNIHNCKKFILGHFFAIFIKKFINNFLYGFLIKPYKLYCFIKNYFLHFCLFFLKNNLIFQFTTLSDICVVDYPQRLKNRFYIVYVLLSTSFNIRLFLCLFVNNFIPLISITRFYTSSN